MKALVVLVAASGLCAWSQSLDLSSLDKIASKASEVNKVSLDRDQLQTVMKMVPDDEKSGSDKAKKLMGQLESVQVRNYEFEHTGAYTDADLDAVRSQISKMHGCVAIVDSKEKDEHSQVFMCSEDNKPSGLAVISAEAKELSFVFIKGNLNLSDLSKLGGVMGMPHMALGPLPHGDAKSDSKKTNEEE